jgi:hypothetical protein
MVSGMPSLFLHVYVDEAMKTSFVEVYVHTSSREWKLNHDVKVANEILENIGKLKYLGIVTN